MNTIGWIQLLAYVAILLAITKPLGVYLCHVLDPAGKTFLDPALKPVERLLYKIFGVNPLKEQSWKHYTVAMLLFSAVSALFTYAILHWQGYLPWHGNLDALTNKTPMTSDLNFNTSVSFLTNTNWQSYGGENTMSYFSQMVALASHNFWSAAVGIAIAAALVRGISRDKFKTIGNFWADLVRIQLYLLIPICIIFALALVSQGMIQNFKSYTKVPAEKLVDSTGGTTTQVDPKDKDKKAYAIIPQGPVASQVAIKMLGTNGGGFFNANAAHPFENPTPLSNFLQMLSIFAIPSALTYYLGRMVKNQKHGWAVWAAMFVLFMAGVLTCWWAESAGNPRMHDLGIAHAGGNMEGKETRFGIFSSALFATITTDASCGAVNCMHDSLTPVGGLVPMFNIHLGEVVFGGVGAGLYGMLVFVVIAIFIAGLMVGRTPEYLGKKIEAYDVKVASLSILILTVIILGFSAWAVIAPWGGLSPTALTNSGPHGFSEIHYAYTSGAGNNGSAFAGLSANEVHWNTTLGFDMLLGRFFMIVPILALAGSLAAKKKIPQSVGSFPVSGPTFVVLLIGTVIIVGALTFVPALSVGPIVEHFLMHGKLPLY